MMTSVATLSRSADPAVVVRPEILSGKVDIFMHCDSITPGSTTQQRMKNAFALLREMREVADSSLKCSPENLIHLLSDAEEASTALFLLAVADKDVEIISDLSKALNDAYAEHMDKALDVLFRDHPRYMYHVGRLYELMMVLLRFRESWGSEVEARRFLASPKSRRMRYVLLRDARHEAITFARLNRLLGLDPAHNWKNFEKQHYNLRLLARVGFGTVGMQYVDERTDVLCRNYMLTREGVDAIKSVPWPVRKRRSTGRKV